jgi:para-aminobenzoate synthetase component 1
MNRTTKIFQIEDTDLFKQQLFEWAQSFQDITYLDSHTAKNHQDIYSQFDALLAVDAFTAIKTDALDGFSKLNDYQLITNDWLFGFMSFELKEDSHHLPSKQENLIDFPELYFFQPKKLILLKNNQVYCHYLPLCDDEIEVDFAAISAIHPMANKIDLASFELKPRTSKANYLQAANQLLAHIQRGDIYEINYCLEFYADEILINPFSVFKALNNFAQSPFASFFRSKDLFIMSATPERYLQRFDNKVVSQPIKGTAKRFLDHLLDEKSKSDLKSNDKEISENVMIVDLVRNDLSITAKKKTVQVEELCEVYTFNQVHQMISTISSKVEQETTSSTLLKTTFPMGSMTGAPKKSALSLIETFEDFRRGIYSGSVGYFDPKGNFDFNVIIRTLLYNAQKKYLSYGAGSALTARADAEKEYEECLLKVAMINQIFKN